MAGSSARNCSPSSGLASCLKRKQSRATSGSGRGPCCYIVTPKSLLWLFLPVSHHTLTPRGVRMEFRSTRHIQRGRRDRNCFAEPERFEMQRLNRRVPGALLLALAMTLPVQAASPSLGGINPRGVQRGVENQMVFSGGRLQDCLLYTSDAADE